jgi:hypothetical protein
MPEEFLQELQKVFREDIEELQEMTGRDPSRWR